MSVLIPGMEMPKDCWMCNFVDRDYGNCLVDGKEHGDYNKPENCPLVPVPKHGRLIDADAMIRDIEKSLAPSWYIKERNADMVKFLSVEDTIIPASEEGEG